MAAGDKVKAALIIPHYYSSFIRCIWYIFKYVTLSNSWFLSVTNYPMENVASFATVWCFSRSTRRAVHWFALLFIFTQRRTTRLLIRSFYNARCMVLRRNSQRILQKRRIFRRWNQRREVISFELDLNYTNIKNDIVYSTLEWRFEEENGKAKSD